MEEAGMVAEETHDRKLLKSLEVCQKEGIHFVPLAWESALSGEGKVCGAEMDVSETTRLATTVLRFCFVTTMFATFLVMQLEVLASRQS